MRVYHFVPAKWGLENVHRRRLKIATIADLNDPFELTAFSTDDEHVAFIFKLLKEELSKNKGILCFSEEWSNPVQWAHYADRHRGICLGFDVPDSLLMKVDYVETRLTSKNFFLDRHRVEAAIQKALGTKFAHWSYEREWRMWIEFDHAASENGRHFQSFSSSLMLKEVTLGYSSELTSVDILRALGEEYSDVAVYRAQLARNIFGIDRIKDKTQRTNF